MRNIILRTEELYEGTGLRVAVMFANSIIRHPNIFLCHIFYVIPDRINFALTIRMVPQKLSKVPR